MIGPGDTPEYDGDAVLTDEPVYAGAAVAAVAADTADAADRRSGPLCSRSTRCSTSGRPGRGVEAQRFLGEPSEYERGDAEAALKRPT